MENNFICPHCKGEMMVAGNVIFSATTKKDNKVGLILLDPKIGDYTSKVHANFIIEKGEEVEFHCPICNANLAADDVNKNMVRVIMIDGEKNEYEIFFSGIAGEHCTYTISERKFDKAGEDSEKYLSYFKFCEKYKGLL